jgi:catechol 2,3-dioxygenase-like lactoylglutathione lyase family enzyme
MALNRIDHLSIRTTRLDATRQFYVDVLGLEEGYRPPFKFGGAWLYSHGQAAVHVVEIDLNNPGPVVEYLGEGALRDADNSGSVDHLAFTASDAPGMKARFDRLGVPYRERQVPSMNLTQLFVDDPNGITIELNFPG